MYVYIYMYVYTYICIVHVICIYSSCESSGLMVFSQIHTYIYICIFTDLVLGSRSVGFISAIYLFQPK